MDWSEVKFIESLSFRVQAKRLPSVYRVAADAVHLPSKELTQSKYIPEIETVKSCPEEYLPSEQWERDCIFQFSSLRMVRKASFNKTSSSYKSDVSISNIRC